MLFVQACRVITFVGDAGRVVGVRTLALWAHTARGTVARVRLVRELTNTLFASPVRRLCLVRHHALARRACADRLAIVIGRRRLPSLQPLRRVVAVRRCCTLAIVRSVAIKRDVLGFCAFPVVGALAIAGRRWRRDLKLLACSAIRNGPALAVVQLARWFRLVLILVVTCAVRVLTHEQVSVCFARVRALQGRVCLLASLDLRLCEEEAIVATLDRRKAVYETDTF